jgi:hypothetical protein
MQQCLDMHGFASVQKYLYGLSSEHTLYTHSREQVSHRPAGLSCYKAACPLLSMQPVHKRH